MLCLSVRVLKKKLDFVNNKIWKRSDKMKNKNYDYYQLKAK